MTTETPQKWAGQRLGLNQTGSGSLATMPRRIAAICIDWGCALLVSHAFFTDDSTATLAIFALMQWLLTGTLGFSFGHRLLGLRLVRTDLSSRPGPWKALLRVALLCLVIPVAVWDADNRGLHDKAAGTILVRS